MSNDQRPMTPTPRDRSTTTPPRDRAATVEQQVRELLTTAQQQVRFVIEQEVEGEPITKELLNLRLKKTR